MSNHEPVLLVSRHNHPRGSCQRGRMQRQRLIHRASYVVVQDLAGRVCVQKRADDKHFYPGGWDLAAGGVMRPDESPAANLSRELFEELGVQRHFRRWQWFWFANPHHRVWGALARVTVCPRAVSLSDEVVAVDWLPARQALALENATPDTRVALSLLLASRR
ncbi:Nudix hydrolase [Alcanivorax hongdengensis A-11-3]|uniref:Nudix hydrolase n=1 Tax=Alcanivorax hongdengensis A-11-3 TaxID=1177179 RepID=L0W9M0_9GAMM|nr:NUDIX domain-containing protein [Alcanivorax hongdengensis]EKF73699.1 Nudix hydrolase [Alcanivorax hongdengensis A-11-3]